MLFGVILTSPISNNTAAKQINEEFRFKDFYVPLSATTYHQSDTYQTIMNDSIMSCDHKI